MKFKPTKEQNLPQNGSYGANYMVRVQKPTSSSIPYPLPRMGFEVFLVRSKYDVLMLQNICGQFYLASHTTPKDQWATIFDVHLEN